MRKRTRKYEDISSVDFLLLRDDLGLKRFRKQTKRNEEERKILMDLALKKIRETEENDFLLIEKRRRRINI